MPFCQLQKDLYNEQTYVGASPSAGFGSVVCSVFKKPG